MGCTLPFGLCPNSARCAVFELEVLAAQVRELGGPQPGLHRKSSRAWSRRPVQVERSARRVARLLGLGEVADQRRVEPFLGIASTRAISSEHSGAFNAA